MIKTKIVIFIVLVVIVTPAGVGFWYAHKSKNNIDCEGRVVWEINNEEFRGDVAYQMQNNQGSSPLPVICIRRKIKNLKLAELCISPIIRFVTTILSAPITSCGFRATI